MYQCDYMKYSIPQGWAGRKNLINITQKYDKTKKYSIKCSPFVKIKDKKVKRNSHSLHL